MSQVLGVSSSLSGRDLALLKSMINILGTEDDRAGQRVALEYTDADHSGIHIFTENADSATPTYCAMVDGKKVRKDIGKEINPKVLRRFFSLLFSSNTDASSTQTQAEFIDSLYQSLHHGTNNVVAVTSGDLTIIFDKPENKVYSSRSVDENCLQELSNQTASFKCYPTLSRLLQDNELNEAPTWHANLHTLLWRYALTDTDHHLSQKLRNDDCAFEQISWPDYGSLPFNSKHVFISSTIMSCPTKYDALMQQDGFLPKDVDSYINAGCLSGHVLAHADSQSDGKIRSKSNDGFISRLKHKFFG